MSADQLTIDGGHDTIYDDGLHLDVKQSALFDIAPRAKLPDPLGTGDLLSKGDTDE